MDAAGSNVEQGRTGRSAIKDHISLADEADIAVERELAHLQRRQIAQDVDFCAQQVQPFVNGSIAREAAELGFQNRFIGK
jgi:hypothetical protein